MRSYNFPWTQLIAAGGTFNPLLVFDYETPDADAVIVVTERATAVGLRSSVKSASDSLKPEGPVQSGGTAGVTPSPLNTTPFVGRAPRSRKLSINYSNPTGGGITVDGLIEVTMKGGGR